MRHKGRQCFLAGARCACYNTHPAHSVLTTLSGQGGANQGTLAIYATCGQLQCKRLRGTHLQIGFAHGRGQNTVNAACIQMPEDANNCHILAKMCAIFLSSVNTFLGKFLQNTLHPLLLTHGHTDSKLLSPFGPVSHAGDTLLRVAHISYSIRQKIQF